MKNKSARDIIDSITRYLHNEVTGCLYKDIRTGKECIIKYWDRDIEQMHVRYSDGRVVVYKDFAISGRLEVIKKIVSRRVSKLEKSAQNLNEVGLYVPEEDVGLAH